jgi:hypothetical protein
MKLWLSSRASSWAKTRTLRARSVKRSNTLVLRHEVYPRLPYFVRSAMHHRLEHQGFPAATHDLLLIPDPEQMVERLVR